MCYHKIYLENKTQVCESSSVIELFTTEWIQQVSEGMKWK